MKLSATLAIMASALLLAACGSDPAEEATPTGPADESLIGQNETPISTTIYSCGTETVTADVYANAAMIQTNIGMMTLPQVPSGSGIRYEAETQHGFVTFWAKGRDAGLEINGVALDQCFIQSSTMFATEDNMNLTGHVWVVEDLMGQGIPDMARAELHFEDTGAVSGRTGCNQFTGTYEMSDRLITFSALATTRRACPPALMDMESKFLSVLASPVQASVDETGALLLSSETGTLLAR
ncbi:META domain-containing protein [Ponticaulis sp.]|uniref:META domain-containing protein n=1 Tax=Ponticaulis sp. TaxID=2020902 RepID=UPI000B64BD73|nr:META domain-containing protein [Ponticaulis sp.]MAI89848.1 hypothetical protein [Ponticaulis sp.]OUX99522.1 MAG: hypothetical protein CBB65_05355 [Hyphomonadaceae bacterium TMED5]|tara:strand:- start:81206 stop:81922 length:717 start_codon:yes stop_codon:yes gene_type:complete